MPKRILIVEDDPTMALGMEHMLRSEGYVVVSAANGKEGIDLLQKETFDLIITDLRLPVFDGFEILRTAKQTHPHAGVIIITGYAEVKDAVNAMRQGAFDYIAKPFSNDELLIAIEKYIHYSRLETEITQLKETLREKIEFENIIGLSAPMKHVFDYISSVAGTDVPVLIRGESGTGKELVANAIHNLSKRHDKYFLKINCAAIPETLFEAEVFGHEKGAFTGALKRRLGKFEYADGGTIFFDEIGDIPMALQPKLLRVLEESAITRLGDNRPQNVDVRTIYATKRNLKDAVARGTFREDLYYRLNVMPITLPPLRERKEDIPYLIDYFLKYFNSKFNKQVSRIEPPALSALLSYDYPGNVRELKHAVERAVVLAKDKVITINELAEEITGKEELSPCINEEMPLEQSLRCFEKQRILRALKETKGRKIEAANLLGITRKVLWKKLKEYDIEYDHDEGG